MDEVKREYRAYGGDISGEESPRENRLSKTGSASRSVGSSHSAGSKKSSGGFFSFLKWFKKDKSEEEEEAEEEEEDDAPEEVDTEDPSAPNSPALRRVNSSSICGSVDTLFSTATASSFAFVHPSYYRPFGAASQAETRIAAGPETATYRNRIRERDRARLLENKLSLREKYNLYASGTLRRSVDHIHEIEFEEKLEDILTPIDNTAGSKNSTLGRKKRKAPPPPFKEERGSSDLSLPATLEVAGAAAKSPELRHHRRTVSESAKYKVGCHVKGKRKAPPPPDQKTEKSLKLDVAVSDDKKDNEGEKSTDNSIKKKRPAPAPPTAVATNCIEGPRQPCAIADIINRAALDILNEAEKPPETAGPESATEETISNASTLDIELAEVSTDTLRLEKGVLMPNKMDRPASEPKVAPTSPVSPRPWYKRGAATREQPTTGSGNKKKEREKKLDDWMLESGFPRRTSFLSSENTKFNIFTKLDRPEEKRKSQISILTNISELDREAAEIVQKGKAREQALLASHDAKYYTNNIDDAAANGIVQEVSDNENVEIPKKSSTRELISLFNAITNVTKVTVNSSFFSKDGSNILRKENNATYYDHDKGEKVTIRETKVKETTDGMMGRTVTVGTRDIITTSPGTEQIVSTFEVNNAMNLVTENDKRIARVTIEELDEYDAESPAGTKAQALYEANRLVRHQSPAIPTIVEVSESSVRTSPASTIDSTTTETTSATESGVPAKRESVWICPRCTLENVKWKITCEACDMWRPSPLELKTDQTEAAGAHPSASKLPLYKPILESISQPAISNPAYRQPDTEKDSPPITESSSRTEPFVKPSDIKTVIKNETPINNTNDEKLDLDENKNTADILDDVKAEDVRKARLAYFNKTGISYEKDVASSAKDTQTAEESKPTARNADRERMMLREMLKEMKHSLPKRPKNVTVDTSKNEFISPDTDRSKRIEDRSEDSVEADVPKTGAIRKTPKFGSPKEKRYSVNSKGDLAEAYLVDTETRVEEIKVKKSGEKVSSSAQTNSTVRQVVPQVTLSPSKPKEVIVPITMEDYTLKEGKLQMSISRQAKRIGTGSFELMRPRDFASIEAIKTGGMAPAHLYANLPDHLLLNQPQQPSAPKSAPDRPSPLSKIDDSNVKVSFEVDGAKAVNTLAVNRLLKKLEAAIAGGQHDLAAGLAKDLARLKVNCSVTRQKPQAPPQQIMVEMYVEDKVSHQGPIPVRIMPSMTVEELKRKLEKEFEIPVGVQRWILGKQLATNDTATLEELGVNAPGLPIFLYLVAPDVGQLKENSEGATALEPSAPINGAEAALDTKDKSPPQTIIEEEEEDDDSYCGDDEMSKENSPQPKQQPVQPPIAHPAGDKSQHNNVQITTAKSSIVQTPATKCTTVLQTVQQPTAKAPAVQATNTKALPTLQQTTAKTPIVQPIVSITPTVLPTTSKAPTVLLPTTSKAPTVLPTTSKTPTVQSITYKEPTIQSVTAKMPTVQPTTSKEPTVPSATAKTVTVQSAISKPSTVQPTTSKAPTVQPTTSKAPTVQPTTSKEPTVQPTTSKTPTVQPTNFKEPSAQSLTAKAPIVQATTAKGLSALQPTTSKIPIVQPTPSKALAPQPSTSKSPSVQAPTLQTAVAQQPRDQERFKRTTVADKVPKVLATGTLALGWKCARCTLVNSPTRPGCAACATERPTAYVVPVEYRASQAEIERLGKEQHEEEETAKALEEDKQKNYQQLMDLEKNELVISVEAFECPVCLVEYQPMEGVVLHECLHTFCRQCLAHTVEFSEEAEVKCPYRDNNYTCNGIMLEREIKALVTPQVYEQHLAKSIALAENNIGNAFHCKTPDCKGWCIYEDNVNIFRCPVCTHTNCLTCQAIHEGLNCKQYQEQLNTDSPTSEEAKRTKEMLKEMVDRGEAMNCPTCQVVLMKKWGCDWLRCSMCKTEICWVTRGPRWGPNGKGDTSGGCQCGVNGVKCHPKCNYCH